LSDSKHIPSVHGQSSSAPTLAPLFQEIAEAIRQARNQLRQSVNQAMVQCYWQIGCLIVEHEQQATAGQRMASSSCKRFPER